MSTGPFLHKVADDQDHRLALKQRPLNVQIRWAQPKRKKKFISWVSELNNSDMTWQLVGDTAVGGQELWWGLEMPWRVMCLGSRNWTVRGGMVRGGIASERSKHVECGSIMLVGSRAALRADHPLPQHPSNVILLRSSSVPLDFCKHLFSRACYIWMSLGRCSLQPNESNQNIHFYGQIFCSISISSIAASPSTL